MANRTALPNKRVARLEIKQVIDNASLNNRKVESITLERGDARDARGVPIMIDEYAVLGQLIRMVLLIRGKGQRMEPITIESIKRLKELVGIGSLTMRDGRRYWEIREGLGLRLESAGIDPMTGVVVDEEAFKARVRGLKQADLMRVEAKFEGRERSWREEAIRESLGRWRPSAEKKKSIGVEHYVRNQVLNTRIAREIRGMEKED